MPKYKLTPPQAQEIREAKGKQTAKELAAQYGVSTSTVSAIWQGIGHRTVGRIRQPRRGWKAEFLAMVLKERISSWEAARRLGVTVPAISEACDELRQAGIQVVRHNRGSRGESWIEIKNLKWIPDEEG